MATVILSVVGVVALVGLIGLICVGVESMAGRKGTIFSRIGRK